MKFTDILDEYKIPYREAGEDHHVSSGWIGLACPFCSSGEGKYHLGYNLESRYITCWKCGYHSMISLLMELTSEPASKCYSLLGGIDFERHRKFRPKGRLELPYGCGEMLSPHRKYLRKRRFDDEELEKLWGLQGIGMAPRLPWRIVIPIHHKGFVVSWTSRKISDRAGRTRYTSAKPTQEAMSARELLYGEDYARQSIIICEGPTDVWRIGPGAVATLGTGFSRAQLNRMASYPKRMICFDAEEDAKRRANKLCRALEVFPGETINITLESAKDAGAASEKEIRQLRKMLR